MANTIAPSIAVKISANAAGFAQTVNNAANSLKALEKQAQFANNLLMGFGVGFGAYQLASGIGDVISKMANFEAEMSKVKAVTNATETEFNQLRDSALGLAQAYGVSTKGVAELQTQYARLGFSTTEILQSSKVAIQLSRATGEDLAKSAQIAGSTLRSFNLDASEMGRVGDVMAKAFNTSALGLDDFGEAIKYVAPIAKAANISLEETVAMLAALADAGMKGSQPGTSLRKIFGDIAKDGRPVVERLDELAKRGLSLAESFDEAGRTAQNALLVIVDQNGKIKNAEESYKSLSGELDSVAGVVKDNLLGDWEKLNSQFEVTIQKGEGGVIPVLRTILGILKGGVAAIGGDIGKDTTGNNWFLNALGIYPDTFKKESKEIEASMERLTKAQKLINEAFFGGGAKAYVNPVIVEFGKELTKLSQTQKESLTPLESERALRAKLSELQEKALGQVDFVRAATNKEIEDIEKKIEALQKLGRTVKENKAEQQRRDEVKYGIAKDPEEKEETSTINALYGEQLAADNLLLENKINLQSTLTDIISDTTKEYDLNSKAMRDLANASMALGEGIGSVISGSQTAAEAFSRYADDVVKSIGRMIMAQMIEAAIRDKATNANFFAKLALIGVATGVASGLIRKIGASGSGGWGGGAVVRGGGGYSGGDISSSNPIMVNVGFTGDAGKVLKTISINQDRYDSRTKG